MGFSIRDIAPVRSIICGIGRLRGGGSPIRTSPIRTYGPTDLEDTFLIDDVGDEFEPVVAKIVKLYGMVEVPANRNGFCFGLLDPVSNIVVGSAIAPAIPASGQPAEGGRDEKQAAHMAMRSLSGLLAFLTRLFPYLPVEEALGYLDSAGADPLVACHLIVRRRGMREFDPCSFTNMAAIEKALRCAAVAAGHPNPQQLVQQWKLLSPYLDRFRFSYDPRSRTRDVTLAVLDMVNNGAGTSHDSSGIIMEKSWYFANIRLDKIRVKELPPALAAMKRMLLATIHGFYLEALARLPATELCSQYHRSMLMGGYCYGPLDPASNIILNTLWYEQRFPSTKDITLQMISTKCLWRIAARSLYALVSFLCTRYPALTPDLAMQRLLVARADLRAADPNLPVLATMLDLDSGWSGRYQVGSGTTSNREVQRIVVDSPNSSTPDRDIQPLQMLSADSQTADPNHPAVARRHVVSGLDWSGCYQVGSGTTGARELQRRAVDSCIPSASAEEAYAAAATAAFHPDPSAQKELLGSPSVMPRLHVASERLRQGHVLSAQDVLFLSQLLCCPSSIRELDQQQQTVRRKKAWYTFESNCRGRFWDQHDRVCSMVEAALDAFNEGKELKYSLHVICGVNELVSGPEFSTDPKIRGYNPWSPFKYYHKHINFLATCGGSKPTLFFAECSNHGKDKAWCIPVEPLRPLAENVRCIYCEYEGNRIVHPAVQGFHGGDREFEKVLRGEPLFKGSEEDLYSNDRIITDKQEEVDWVNSVSDEYVYSVNTDAPPDDDDRDDDRPESVYKNDRRIYIQFD